MLQKTFNKKKIIEELDHFIYNQQNAYKSSLGTVSKVDFLEVIRKKALIKAIKNLSEKKNQNADADYLYYSEIIKHLIQDGLVYEESGLLSITSEGREYLKNSFLFFLKKNSATTISSLALLLTIFAIGINIWQIIVNQNLESNKLMFDISKDFRTGNTSHLIYAIAIDEEPLLEENGGKFSDEELDNYLVRYELLYKAFEHKIINEDMLSIAFGYDIEKAYENKEILSFIDSVRNDAKDSELYIDFIKLAELEKNKK